MINRYPILACILTCLLAGYLCFAIPVTNRVAAGEPYAAVQIVVADTAHTQFVTAGEVSSEADGITNWISERPRSAVDLEALETRLRASDKVETLNVYVLGNGVLRIDVTPMVPVARIFDTGGSYYINVQGKRITADPRYHVDVPVVTGHFNEEHPAQRLLPMLSYIAAHPALDALVSTLHQEPSGDITLVPTIRGHVVNFGDTTLVADKFNRLTAFYRQVMPVRGWETYDTVAVKWRGQVVATRRDKTLQSSSIDVALEQYDEFDDLETILTPEHTRLDSLAELTN